MDAEANGQPVGRVTLDARSASHRLRLPAKTLRDGPNDLVFRYAWSRSPRQLGLSGDARRLAVRWEAITFADAVPSAGGEAAAAEGGLLLPAGTQLDWYLELPAGSELRLGPADWRGAGAGRVEVVLEADGGTPSVVASAAAGELPERIALVRADTVVRLGVRALGPATPGRVLACRRSSGSRSRPSGPRRFLPGWLRSPRRAGGRGRPT